MLFKSGGWKEAKLYEYKRKLCNWYPCSRKHFIPVIKIESRIMWLRKERRVLPPESSPIDRHLWASRDMVAFKGLAKAGGRSHSCLLSDSAASHSDFLDASISWGNSKLCHYSLYSVYNKALMAFHLYLPDSPFHLVGRVLSLRSWQLQGHGIWVPISARAITHLYTSKSH